MASFKGKGRDEGSKRRAAENRRIRLGRPNLELESLEQRRLLTGPSKFVPTSTDVYDVQNGPLAPMGKDLIQVYHDYIAYQQSGGHGAFTTSESSKIVLNGLTAAVDIQGTGNLQVFSQALAGLGFQVAKVDARNGIVTGYAPFQNLPAIVSQAQTIGVNPVYKPHTKFVGQANNEAETAQAVQAARSQFNVDGTGQKIGVISDSANQFNGGLAASVATGDLPNNVQVLVDGPAGSTDEGRAMLENIHDIAPGASLAFASGGRTDIPGQAGFADSILSLKAAGAGTIVDDLAYPGEPYYQDGVISQAVNTVVSQGAAYFTAASNSADSGYQSTFRGVNATVTGLGAGRYMNFDPTGATTATQLGIRVYGGGVPSIEFQFDQPFRSPNGGVVSNVEFDIFNAAGTLVFQGNNNTIANNTPDQISNALAPGDYTVAIKVDAGPDPGHVVFFANDGGFAVDQKFGSAGGTFYPSSPGHESGANSVSVGAVPWWTAPAYLPSNSKFVNEPFSSFGPRLILFNPDGTPTAPQLLNKPDISAADGGNTSFFFPPGSSINTTQVVNPANPAYPGNQPTTTNPATTTTNLSQNLPSFFGTSAACENVAAVAALMKQLTPGISQASILSALTSTATPLNGQAKGTFNIQSGYGFVNAPAALSAIQSLKVVFIAPGASQTVTSAPTFLQVQFSQPVNLATIAANALMVQGPNGATVSVGKPFGFDDPVFPTFVRFPITITPAPNTVANGVYNVVFNAGTVTAQNGLVLQQGVVDRFTIAQVNGPQVTNVNLNGRIVTVTFNEALNPSTIGSATLFLFRAGGVGNPLFNPSDVIVSQLPGAKFSYNAQTFTATIDLTGVDQSQLPTDHYAIYADNVITDAIGNKLNGQFNGVFPSGVFPSTGAPFLDDLGTVILQPPKVSFLQLAPQTDSGIAGDNNTRVNTPSFVGQVTSTFPGSLAGLLVYAEFNGIAHAGVARGALDLSVGANGRGFVGHFDVQTVTDANGQFVINYPPGVAPLPEGQDRLRVVVVGQADQPPFPGLSSSQDTAFRIDNSLPYVGTTDGSPATSIPQNGNINSLSNLSISIIDPVNPTTLGDPFAVDPKLAVPALNPTQANNISNYRLFQIVNGAKVDRSSFLSTASFVSTSTRTLSSDPFTGKINFTFTPGLPTGQYDFEIINSAFPPAGTTGISDAAGNAFAGYPDRSALGQPFNFGLNFNLQPTPTYIYRYAAYSPDPTSPNGTTITDTRANYEIPVPGITARAPAGPIRFSLDFSNSLRSGVDYSNAVQLMRSANSNSAKPDGDFGDLGITNTNGFTRVSGVTVTLASSVAGAGPGQFGYNDRLIVSLPAGASLPADYYRLYLPNNGPTAITDVFGSQLDGEFKGYKDSSGTYVDLLPNGQVRGNAALPDLSGDGTPGGAFVTGFVVVPNGNIIYARADALYNPQVPSLSPTGAVDRPYPVLAPEAVFNNINGGDLNSVANSGANFNSVYDRSGDGQFEPSAFFAAQQRVQANGGPAVILAVPSIPSRDPLTGLQIQKPFVLQAPSGSDPTINDGSAAVPALTTLTFQPGTILKMQNASLLVQNQGSALQILGAPNSGQGVTITSYKDSTVGGVSNNDPSTVGSPGDYGGILFRNFSQAALPGGAARTTLFPGQIAATGVPSIDQRLKGPFTDPSNPASQVDAVSGADDVMSLVNFLTERYAGGVVPQTVGLRYDGITLKNSRPAIVNSMVTDTNGQDGSAQAGLSVDVDSLRSDDNAQGPLVRNDVFLRNGLNGIYIRAEISGIAEPTDAVAYPNNPTTQGGSRNYTLNNPYPYLLTSRLDIGQALVQETGGTQSGTRDRLYITPGMILKFSRGSALEVTSAGASLNIGDQTYIREFDANNNLSPSSPGFTANSSTLAQTILTSINDDVASTFFFDPLSQTRTTIVQPLPAVPGGSGILQPTPGNVNPAARWGGVSVVSGGIAVINSANLRYGGGEVNTGAGTGTQHVLELGEGFNGARISVTNNVFNDNLDVPINMKPDSLLAGDPQKPLLSGDPFIHGNVFTGNGINGVGVDPTTFINDSNLDVNSVWTGTDFTYILRKTIVLGGGLPANPSISQLQPILRPQVLLTLQSTLAGTILADGTKVPAPGIPLIVKLMNQSTIPNNPLAADANPAPALGNAYLGGAGFLVGVDDGVDPTAVFQRNLDPGAFSQIRIVGIGANQTTGQSRVPVVITSIHDSTYGTTVNNVPMFQAIPGDTTAPKPGDGGVIYFGGNSLTDYDLQDPRNGSLIDNADIKYITRIEQQGGGINYLSDINGDNAFTPTGANNDNPYAQKLGYALGLPNSNSFGAQYNQAKQLTISNSNLSTFSDYAFVAHPGYNLLQVPLNFVSTAIRAGYLGEATHTYFVNDTISNMVRGVEIISENSDNTALPSPAMAVFLNNTFYNIGAGANSSTASPSPAIRTFAPVATGTNSLSSVSFLAMDNIFSTIQGDAVDAIGQSYSSDLQYNLFELVTGTKNVGVPNDGEVLGSAQFRNAAGGNFFLLPNSDAIDRARSELGPSIYGDMLYPASSYVAPGTNAPGNPLNLPIRTVFGPGGTGAPTGSVNAIGGVNGGTIPFAVDLVTLPGEPVNERGFPDQWVPVLQSGGSNSFGTGTNPATFLYVPLQGERDQAGNLRIKDPNSPNVGFGSRPFFDLGAFEFIIQSPPIVTAVQAIASGIASNLYVAGGIAGTNKTPSSIQVRFNERLDPTTITGSSVILQASGGDGIFGNSNSPADRFINLSGLLSFDPNTNILTIDTSSILANPATLNDEYRLVLKGTGGSVIRDRSGLVLDGFTNNQTLPLPSGSDNFPGSDFQVTFTISTHSPTVIPGSFHLSAASDTSGGRFITKQNLPTFVGSITDVFPPLNAVLGQSVHIDISSKGDGNFDIIDAGIGTTDINGNFSVTLTKPIPDTPNTVPASGIKGGPGATYAFARVRVINQAGNASNQVTDPISAFQAAGALAPLEVDTVLPTVTAFSPLANTVATVNANGTVTVNITFSENVKGSSLNPNSIQVFRTGGTGSFTGTLVPVQIDQSSFAIKYLGGAAGAEQVTFNLQGPLPNDQYEIILKGTGANTVTDEAGNPISGAFTGTFPSGGGTNTASDFVNTGVAVYSPGSSHLIYVSSSGSATGTGTRANPFLTIAAGMAKAVIGDDVLVLPGTYRETVVVKPGVRLLSASIASTDAGFFPGSPKSTLIYGPAGSNFQNNVITVYVSGGIVGVPTEVSGFAIISPLLGDPSLGTVNTTNTAILAQNSNVLIDRNFIIDGGVGVYLTNTGVNTQTSQVFDNVIAGNVVGIGIVDTNGAIAAPYQVVNNTITDNTFGLINSSPVFGKTQAFVLNNIFYSNHDLTPVASQRTGTGILSNSANTLYVGYDLFFANGASAASLADEAVGIFTGFSPSALSGVPDARHNFAADPAFVAARDPRPNGDTPAIFFIDGNYDLTSRSAAINAALSSQAPSTDIAYRSPVPISGRGFVGTGPASVGAYYFSGTGGPVLGGGTGNGSGGQSLPALSSSVSSLTAAGIPVGTVATSTVSTAVSAPATSTPAASAPAATSTAPAPRFNLTATSIAANGSAQASVPGYLASEAAPSYIDVTFSNPVDPSTVSPADLILMGTGLDSVNPAKATSLTWIDDHAVRFFLSGSFHNDGVVNVAIPTGAVSDTNGTTFPGYLDAFKVASGGTPAAPATVLLPTQPVAPAGPVAVAVTVATKTAKHQTAKAAHAVKKDNHHPAAVKPVTHIAAPKPKPQPKHKKGK